MTPGLGFFYAGGNVNPRNIMHTIMSSMVAIPLVGIQWYFIGYTLSFSDTGSVFIGDFSQFLLSSLIHFKLIHFSTDNTQPKQPTKPKQSGSD